jgi:hypothetical protein
MFGFDPLGFGGGLSLNRLFFGGYVLQSSCFSRGSGLFGLILSDKANNRLNHNCERSGQP